ncbi:MAG: 2-amino-4-hydroxy-6-hydroxymethyldihydropteridine diphosphokinase [Paludibacteraceae bacterium]|nr:2-amino-4-hydroxy-6-hydroxymethyldihydropteridine diphosphokinase [Paludibacteraceae bacterium]
MITCYLGLGTNLGDRHANLLLAVRLIQERIGRVVAQSDEYHSEPWGFTSPNRFVNIAVAVQTNLLPTQLLTITQEIERRMGRAEKSIDGQYHDRIIDIDILLYGNLRISTPGLTVPHPLIMQRDFVRVPLFQILSPRSAERSLLQP